VPLPPTRIADSRITMSFPTLRALETDDVQLFGRGGIPMTGVAAGVLNVTVADSQHSAGTARLLSATNSCRSHQVIERHPQLITVWGWPLCWRS